MVKFLCYCAVFVLVSLLLTQYTVAKIVNRARLVFVGGVIGNAFPVISINDVSNIHIY